MSLYQGTWQVQATVTESEIFHLKCSVSVLMLAVTSKSRSSNQHPDMFWSQMLRMLLRLNDGATVCCSPMILYNFRGFSSLCKRIFLPAYTLLSEKTGFPIYLLPNHQTAGCYWTFFAEIPSRNFLSMPTDASLSNSPHNLSWASVKHNSHLRCQQSCRNLTD